MTLIDEEVNRFARFLRDEMPAPPHAADKPRQDEIALRVFRAGAEWAMLTDVAGSEMSALSALITILAEGFQLGVDQRPENDESGETDSILNAQEITG